MKRHIPRSILSEFMEYFERKYELDAKDINRTIKDYVKIHQETDGKKIWIFLTPFVFPCSCFNA